VNASPEIATDSSNGAILTVHVLPNSSRTECIGIHGDAVKIRVAAPPVGGAANDELVQFLADCCAVPRGAITILSGFGGRHKRLCLKGVSARSALAHLIPSEKKGGSQ